MSADPRFLAKRMVSTWAVLDTLGAHLAPVMTMGGRPTTLLPAVDERQARSLAARLNQAHPAESDPR